MLILLSPAKKLNFSDPFPLDEKTQPVFTNKTNKLAIELKKLKKIEVQKLMKLSEKLGELNYERFQMFDLKKPQQTKQAIGAFAGDTYTGLDYQAFSTTELEIAQNRIRILSGLYGLLRPFDQIQPYRLEMGTKFKFEEFNNLYDFWRDDITKELNTAIKKNKFSSIVNCASNEYFGAVNKDKLCVPLITPVFKEEKNGVYKIISFNAKKARGMMAQYIVKNKIKDLKGIRSFNFDNYKYSAELSSEYEPTFIR